MAESMSNVKRCELCLQRGKCQNHELPKKWGMAIDHCPYFTTLHIPPAVLRGEVRP